MSDKLIGFIFYTDIDDMSEYYGVAVEDSHVVEWNASEDWDHRGSATPNYQEKLMKYGAPKCFTDYDAEEDERCEIWDKFEQHKSELLAAAKKEAASWAS